MLIKYKLFNHCQYQYAQCQVYLKNDKNTISVHLNHVQQQPMTFIVVRIFHPPLKEFLSSKNPHPSLPSLKQFPRAQREELFLARIKARVTRPLRSRNSLGVQCGVQLQHELAAYKRVLCAVSPPV